MVQPAQAAESDIYDPESIVSSIAPEIITGDTANDSVKIDERNSKERDVNSTNISVKVDAPEDISAAPLTLSIDNSVRKLQDGEFTVLEMASSKVATYVQPSFMGVRLLTAIDELDGDYTPSFSLDVPIGTELVETSAAYTLVAPNGDEYGSFEHPWAKDSAGHELSTKLVLKGTTLTQEIDVSSNDVAYPLLADTHWEYAYTYDVGSITATKAHNKMHTCFNCIFPVSGAPQQFPVFGDRLPLTINILGWDVFPMTCQFMFESYLPAQNYFHFSFLAIENHIDGAGSSIDFEVVKIGGEWQLRVYAWILNPFTPQFKIAYQAGAYGMWSTFADNLQMVSVET